MNFRGGIFLSKMKFTGIDEWAFYNITSVTIPNSVTIIDKYAFNNCINLVSAKFLGDAPTIGEETFNKCSSSFKIYYIDGKSGLNGSSITWKSSNKNVVTDAGKVTRSSRTRRCNSNFNSNHNKRKRKRTKNIYCNGIS